MMVMRRKTGWEGLADNPVMFFQDVLNIRLTLPQRRVLADIVDEREMRVGLVWDPVADEAVDDAAFGCGIALWRAATMHVPTVLWGGRRSVASAWIDHTISVLAKAAMEFRSDFKVSRAENVKRWGILLPNGAWALRFDGSFDDDARAACDEMGDRADLLLGDFAWTDRSSVRAAMDYADHTGAVATVLISHGCA